MDVSKNWNTRICRTARRRKWANAIIEACRPRLENVFLDWLEQRLPTDIFSVLNLSGFSVEDPQEEPIRWVVSFETTGDKWLGITIPFVGDTAMEAEVDTC